MSSTGFVLRYFRRHAVWAVVALLATLVFATATLLLVQLVEPIFAEVLLTEVPDGFALRGTEAPTADGAVSRKADTGATTVLREQAAEAKLWLARQLDRGYGEVKSRFAAAGLGPLEFIPLLLVGIFLMRSGADFVNGYAFQALGLRSTTEMRNDLFARLLAQSSRFHAAHPSGELVSRVVSDIGALQSAIANRMVDLMQQSVTLVALLALLFSTNPRLAVICLVAAPAVIVPIVRFGKGVRRTSYRSQERVADLANLVSESVRGHRVVKAFGMEGFESRRFQAATRRHLSVTLRSQLLANLSSPVVESVAAIGAALFLVYAGRVIRDGAMQPAEVVKFMLNLIFLYDPIRKLNKVNLVLQQALAAAQRVQQVMALPIDITDRPGRRPAARFERDIRFHDVEFRYEREPVLRGIDLTVRRGEVVALVGPSGAGKTTLANLLPRFFDPTAGAVEIDGTDIREVALADLRGLIGIVTQETFLFDESVRNNIAYGRADVPFERVRAAAEAAYADEFVAALPRGYDTVIGESGLRLSGGQRQRLAIARALFKDAPILILDEATSQLDLESEQLVQKALFNLMQGRTTLVIAHRLSTIQRADRIVVLEDGRIVEQGDHETLLATGGLYRRLYELQFRSEAP